MGDLETLQGAWRRVSYEDATGKASPDVVRRMANLIFTGDEFTVKTGDYVWTAGFVVIEADQRPKAIDFVAACNGQVLGEPQRAIYELNGNSLTICLACSGDERPREFCATARRSVERLTRVRAG